MHIRAFHLFVRFGMIKVQTCTLKKMNTQKTTFEGFKGEVFNDIKASGESGITFKKLQDKYVSTLLNDTILHGSEGTPNLHATLLVLTNGGHVISSPIRSAVFEASDVFTVTVRK